MRNANFILLFIFAQTADSRQTIDAHFTYGAAGAIHFKQNLDKYWYICIHGTGNLQLKDMSCSFETFYDVWHRRSY